MTTIEWYQRPGATGTSTTSGRFQRCEMDNRILNLLSRIRRELDLLLAELGAEVRDGR